MRDDVSCISRVSCISGTFGAAISRGIGFVILTRGEEKEEAERRAQR